MGKTLDAIKAEIPNQPGDELERRVAVALAPALGTGADRQVAQDATPTARWHRLVIADGIELHVREDSPAARDATLVALREGVRAALGREELR